VLSDDEFDASLAEAFAVCFPYVRVLRRDLRRAGQLPSAKAHAGLYTAIGRFSLWPGATDMVATTGMRLAFVEDLRPIGDNVKIITERHRASGLLGTETTVLNYSFILPDLDRIGSTAHLDLGREEFKA